MKKRHITQKRLLYRGVILTLGYLILGIGLFAILFIIMGLYLGSSLYPAARDTAFVVTALLGSVGLFLLGLRLTKRTASQIVDLGDFDDRVVILRQYISHRPSPVPLDKIRNVSILATKPNRGGNSTASVWTTGWLGVLLEHLGRKSEYGYEPTLLVKTEHFRHYHLPATHYQTKLLPLFKEILRKSPQATWHISVTRYLREIGLENPIPPDLIVEQRDYEVPKYKISAWQVVILVLAALVIIFL